MATALSSLLRRIHEEGGGGKGGRKVSRTRVRDLSRFVKKANAPKQLVMGPKSKYNCPPMAAMEAWILRCMKNAVQ